MKPIPRLLVDIEKCGGVVLGGDFAPDQTGCAFALGPLRVIASAAEGWDHVSVSLKKRMPRYEEMRRVKLLCFRPDEWAIEYHAPPKAHINLHPNVLHIWRPWNVALPVPPTYMV